MPLNEIRARDLYDLRFAYDGTGAAVYDGTWFDLCPDGTIREPAAAGNLPCTGDVVHANDGNEHRGWRLSGDDWDRSGTAGFPGVYYVFRKDAKIGNPGAPRPPHPHRPTRASRTPASR